jgi:hypothetical protein
LRIGVFAFLFLFTVCLTIAPVLGQTNSTYYLQEKFQGVTGN